MKRQIYVLRGSIFIPCFTFRISFSGLGIFLASALIILLACLCGPLLLVWLDGSHLYHLKFNIFSHVHIIKITWFKGVELLSRHTPLLSIEITFKGPIGLLLTRPPSHSLISHF